MRGLGRPSAHIEGGRAVLADDLHLVAAEGVSHEHNLWMMSSVWYTPLSAQQVVGGGAYTYLRLKIR